MLAGPSISIGLPVFNGEEHLSQAVDSLLSQTFTDFELIISDNGSTDRTQEICRSYAANDQRIKYFRSEKNNGAIWNFNRVFELSSADFFMWAAHDDYWDPLYLSASFELIRYSGALVLASSACICVDSQTGEMILKYFGIDTVGLRPADRFRRYKKALHDPATNVNAMFYGIYRRVILQQFMPLKMVMAVDHLLLAALSLSGEFGIVAKDLMVKRYGGASLDVQKVARALQISNSFVFRYPQLFREINLQQIIFQTDRLKWFEKAEVSFWSWCNFIYCAFLNRTKLVYQKVVGG